MRRLFRQFSTPGGVPSHVSVPTPGSIHEGGELGYVLVHAFGAAFDNPDLIVAAVVGDGEAETGPLEGSWKGVRFLNPARDGAVLPILHLNGYKIAGPTVLGRDDDERDPKPPPTATATSRTSSPATTRRPCTALRRHARPLLRDASARSRTTPGAHGVAGRTPRWPAIVLRTPKGWTGPKTSTACPSRARSARTRCRSPSVRTNPEQLAHARSVDAELPARGAVRRAAAASSPSSPRSRPSGDRRMGANPHANGGGCSSTSTCPTSRTYAIAVPRPATERHESTRASASCCATSSRGTRTGELPPLLPRRDQLEPARRRLRGREPLLRRPRPSRSTTTSRPTVG